MEVLKKFMSWIIQSLLNNREHIKIEADLESDQFNDLIILEKAIEILQEKGLLSEEDIDILLGYGTEDTKQKKAERAKKRVALCERVAYHMGGYFTDEGYLSYMQEKYALPDEQVEILRKYINSEYKHRIMRKPSV